MSSGRRVPTQSGFFSWSDLHSCELRYALRVIDVAGGGLVGLPASAVRELVQELEELRREVETWRQETPSRDAQETVLRRASAVHAAAAVLRRTARSVPEGDARLVPGIRRRA
jgi:hypothetical protein